MPPLPPYTLTDVSEWSSPPTASLSHHTVSTDMTAAFPRRSTVTEEREAISKVHSAPLKRHLSSLNAASLKWDYPIWEMHKAPPLQDLAEFCSGLKIRQFVKYTCAPRTTPLLTICSCPSGCTCSPLRRIIFLSWPTSRTRSHSDTVVRATHVARVSASDAVARRRRTGGADAATAKKEGVRDEQIGGQYCV